MADHRASLGRPYTTRRPVPTIQRYVRTQKERREHAEQLARAEADALRDDPDSPVSPGYDDEDARREYYPAEEGKGNPGAWPEADPSDGPPPSGDGDAQGTVSTTSEAHGNGNEANLKRRRKHFQRRRRDKNSREREVTDPVTHLPVRIYDFQTSDLDRIPENLITAGTPYNRLTGVAGKGKTEHDLAAEAEEIDHYHSQLDAVFPLPAHDAIKRRLVGIYSTGVLIGLGSLVAVGYAIGTAERVLVARGGWFAFSFESAVATGGFFAVIYAVFAARQWIANRLDDIWEEELWQAKKEQAPPPKPKPGGGGGDDDDDDEYGDLESTRWLNDLLSSTWPLINPDLFLGASELLEDVMQASLPGVIRMVGVEDIGQGSEPINILGIKWLPTGAAMTSVKDLSGPPTSNSEFVEDVQVARGLEAEDGDFINMEVAFSYRPRTEKSDLVQLSGQSQNAHIYMGFYLPGRIKFPIYAHLKALVGKARMRLTLMPDPPFFSSVTLTLLGQPKVEIACMPLVQKGLNIMDLPLISSFVQSSVDAAVAEYVAPKSISVNLQDLLAGRDYKLDPRARGVVCIHIKRAYGFKEGDQAIPLLRPEGSADPYVTCGWAKYVKPLWSTRVLLAEMQPVWDEMAFLMVTGEELDINERLRIQLWDSDRFTADDDLGRVELELQDLVRNPATVNRMQDRVDGFIALKATDTMPGTMEWSVGYFPKVPIQEDQLALQTAVPELRSIEALHERAEENSRRKLRGGPKIEDIEATKAADVKDMMDRMIASVPPSADFPSGILSVQIHEATGLEIRAHHNADRFNQGGGAVDNEEVESGEELPSAYCNIILNHAKIYRTRVKPKNARPFFNASTERFIRDWRTAELFISVRDSRVHEDDGLMGLVYLPLRDVFRERSQVDKVYPLFGGMGYGRVRISVVFRPVGLQLERKLLGWDYGTLVVGSRLVARGLPADLQGLSIKLDTALSSGHMYYTGPLAAGDDDAGGGGGSDAEGSREAHGWATTGQQRPLRLGVRKRYASPLVLQFRKERRFRADKTPLAFAVLWLQNLPDADDDEPATTVTLPVWKGDLKRATTCALGDESDGSVTRVGAVTLQLAFHRGLGPAHAPLARRDPHVANVIEVVETAAYQLRTEGSRSPSSARRRAEDAAPAASGVQTILGGGDAAAASDDSTASEDDDDHHHHHHHDKADGGGRGEPARPQRPKTSGGGTTTSGSSGSDVGGADGDDKKKPEKTGDDDGEDSDGARGMREAWREYRRNSKQTHRRHRGLMQFKSARTLWWMKHKVDGLQGRVGGLGDHAGARERRTVVESEVR